MRATALLSVVLLAAACGGSSSGGGGGGGGGGTTEVEPNNTAGTANAASTNAVVTASMSSFSDVDYFSFTVPAGGLDVRFQTFDSTGLACATIDPWIEIYTAGGTSMGSDDDSGPNFCEDLTLSLPAGDYVVAVRSWNGPFNYVLAISSSAYTAVNTTLHCNSGSPRYYCDQVSGLLNASNVTSLQSMCTGAGGSYGTGACTGSFVTGYCDLGTITFGATRREHYLSSNYTSSTAPTYCTGTAGGTWVP